MEVELGRGQASQITVTDETFRLGTVIILSEMREGTLVETEGDTLTFDILLSTTGHNLRNIVGVTLRARHHHVNESVVFVKIIKRSTTGFISSHVQSLIDLMFEGLHHTLTGLRLQLAILGLVDDFTDLSLIILNLALDLFHNLRLGDDILHTDGETSVNEPVIDDELDV